jgi:DNA-binding NarL/FixJ family response regulator
VKDTASSSDENSSAGDRKVLVADDHVVVRYGLKMLVTSILGQVQFLEAGDFDSLLRTARSHPTARLALLDVRMRGMQGGLRLADLAREQPGLSLVIVSDLCSAESIRHIMSIRTVRAFVHKSAEPSHLRAAVLAAVQGRKFSFIRLERSSARAAAMLTPRQEQIRDLLRQGMSNKMIAGVLGISEGTVKNHVSDIFKALNAVNRTQAALLPLDEDDPR